MKPILKISLSSAFSNDFTSSWLRSEFAKNNEGFM